MASKARELADVIGTQNTTENVLQGRKNLIINGAMQVWQRGTSFSVNGYSADRWTATGMGSITKYTDSNGQIWLDYTSIGSNWNNVSQFIEDGVKLTRNKTIAISFDWELVTDSGAGHSVRIADETGNVQYVAIDSPTTAERKTIIFSIGAWTVGANLTIGFYNTFSSGGSAGRFRISNVQVELGSVATPFEHRSYGEELALCQRYYWKSFDEASGSPSGSVIATSGVQTQTTTGMVNGCVILPVQLRAVGTCTYYDYNGTVGKVTRYNPNSANNHNEVGYAVMREGGRWLFINSNSGAAASQVGVHVEVDAEL